MRIFPDYNKPGKGVSKDDPAFTGFGLFWFIIKNHYFTLLGLNLLFILATILVVPFGPALKALSRTTLGMVRMETEKPLTVFFKAFKADFVKTALVGVAALAILSVLAFSVYTYIAQNISLAVALSCVLLLLFACVNMYLFKQLAMLDLPVIACLKNGVLLTLVEPKKTALLFVFICIPTFLLTWFISIGAVVILLYLFSINSVISSIIAWDVMNANIVNPNSN